MAQTVKKKKKICLTCMIPRFQSPGWEDSLERAMATHSSILAWRIPWTEEPSELYSPGGHQEFDTTERLSDMNTSLYVSFTITSESVLFLFIIFKLLLYRRL